MAFPILILAGKYLNNVVFLLYQAFIFLRFVNESKFVENNVCHNVKMRQKPNFHVPYGRLNLTIKSSNLEHF